MFARAIYLKPDVSVLPPITYLYDDVVVGSGDYAQTIETWIQGDPTVRTMSTGFTTRIFAYLARRSQLFGFLWSAMGGGIPAAYVKVEMSDESFGVFKVNLSNGSIVAEVVYYEDADGNLVIVDQDAFDLLDDPTIDDLGDAEAEGPFGNTVDNRLGLWELHSQDGFVNWLTQACQVLNCVDTTKSLRRGRAYIEFFTRP